MIRLDNLLTFRLVDRDSDSIHIDDLVKLKYIQISLDESINEFRTYLFVRNVFQ